MNRSPVYYETRQQYGWDTTTSYDHHHAHDSRTERMPSGVLTDDVPRYPNVHKIFNKKMTYEEEAPRKEHSRKDHKKKVQVIETIEEDINNPKGSGQDYEEIVEETIDSEADGFIQQRHKAFELRKWKTFNK
ncbi:hypothetical protein HS088_TW18G00868 [Tripterygium wilfordii]|uniref:Uncharacterized protein n=1 Tax=Tripterygium wilfordii TaxID=458696 RepID=A0A7J7CE73_TRIWF|nr:hypothetical protein HS088_TW18G00868 [Tripterygium wilfordii]